MSWIITGAQPIPAVIGEPFGGGYFAGYISHTADGNPTHALIVAPRATGATGTGYTLTGSLQSKTVATTTPGTSSTFDGAANTAAMVAAGINDHPAASFCVNLNIGGFTDWYLPARHELAIAYFNLKPTTAPNNTLSGTNPYAVPPRSAAYSLGTPAQTTVTAFKTSSEAFMDTLHLTSTELTPISAATLVFSFGEEFLLSVNTAKTGLRSVRAFRRIAL